MNAVGLFVEGFVEAYLLECLFHKICVTARERRCRRFGVSRWEMSVSDELSEGSGSAVADSTSDGFSSSRDDLRVQMARKAVRLQEEWSCVSN